MKLMTIVMMTVLSLSSLANDHINFGDPSIDEGQQVVLLGEDDTPALGDSIGYNVTYPAADSNTRTTAGQDDDQTVLGDFIQY